MIRGKIARCLKNYAELLSPFLLIAGIALMLLLPISKSQSVEIRENAISQGWPRSPQRNSESVEANIPSPERLVRGKRSDGAEVIAVYVNTAYEASVISANFIIRKLANYHMSCDVQFYFVNDSVKWPIPSRYARAALIINFSSLTNFDVCAEIYGRHGIRPNQDLQALLVRYSRKNYLDISFLCQSGRLLKTRGRNELSYFIKSLEESMLADRYLRPWQILPTKGIDTVAFSSDAVYTEMGGRNAKHGHGYLSFFILDLLEALSFLDEKLHHSTFGYIPTSKTRAVSIDNAQIVIILLFTSILCTAYDNYKRSGQSYCFRASLLTLVMTPIASVVYQYTSFPGLFLVTVCFVWRATRMPYVLAWISLNAISVSLMFSLQLCVGLLGGSGVALQSFFLHSLCSRRCDLLLGVFASWAIYWYFIWHLGFPIWSTHTISSTFVSVLIYPNAVLVSGKLIRLLIEKKRKGVSPLCNHIGALKSALAP